MAKQFVFTDPNTGVEFPEAYACLTRVDINDKPGTKHAVIEWGIYASKSAHDAQKSTVGQIVTRLQDGADADGNPILEYSAALQDHFVNGKKVDEIAYAVAEAKGLFPKGAIDVE